MRLINVRPLSLWLGENLGLKQSNTPANPVIIKQSVQCECSVVVGLGSKKIILEWHGTVCVPAPKSPFTALLLLICQSDHWLCSVSVTKQITTHKI